MEDIQLLADDTLLISSERDRENSPWIRRFALDGSLLGELADPGPVHDRHRDRGRTAGRASCEGSGTTSGFEGMALTPSSETLYLANEQALAQDGAAVIGRRRHERPNPAPGAVRRRGPADRRVRLPRREGVRRLRPSRARRPTTASRRWSGSSTSLPRLRPAGPGAGVRGGRRQRRQHLPRPARRTRPTSATSTRWRCPFTGRFVQQDAAGEHQRARRQAGQPGGAGARAAPAERQPEPDRDVGRQLQRGRTSPQINQFIALELTAPAR